MTTRRSETVQQWVSALEGMGRTVKQQGGYWMAQCPAHDDSNPSMQIKDKGDGTASGRMLRRLRFRGHSEGGGLLRHQQRYTRRKSTPQHQHRHARPRPRNRQSRSRYPTARMSRPTTTPRRTRTKSCSR